MGTRYYDVVVNSKDITYDSCGRIENIHRFFLTLDELVSYLKKELKNSIVDIFDVSFPDSRGRYQSVIIGATTCGNYMVKHWVTFDIEARMADTTLYDEGGMPIPYSVTHSALTKNDIDVISQVQPVSEYIQRIKRNDSSESFDKVCKYYKF